MMMSIKRQLAILAVLAYSAATRVLVSAAPRFPCTNGRSMDQYRCRGVDMHAEQSIGERGNKIWGWTDPETSTEYVLMGGESGTHIYDIADPSQPIKVAYVPTASSSSVWRDIKTYQNYAYIVSEAHQHGMQIVDLTQLRQIDRAAAASLPVTIEPVYRYTNFGNCHEIEINQETGYAYCTGSRTCSSGLHMMDLNTNPSQPTFAGCFGEDGYFVSTKCVVYHGPDTTRQGREICFGAAEDTVTVVDVTDKTLPVMLSKATYPGHVDYIGYLALSEDHSTIIVNDLLDELNNARVALTRHSIFSTADLTNLQFLHFHSEGNNFSTDGDVYVKGDLAYSAAFGGGLQILEFQDKEDFVNDSSSASGDPYYIDRHHLFFDTDPHSSSPGFRGTWSVYPYFDSGIIAVASIQRGFFLLELA